MTHYLLKIPYIIIAILPIISIFVTGIYYPANNQPYHPIFQPPNYVFPITWTYITLAFGIISSYALVTIKNRYGIFFLYFYILLSLNIWLVINYQKKYRDGFYLLLTTSFISIIYLILLAFHNLKMTLFLLPLPFWLITATCLNAVIYDKQH